MAATKILSVDDESHIELLLKQYFRRKIRSGEYEYFFARNGREALTILQDHPDIGIILCDINMPEMDGLTLLAKVNELQNPALKVIMVSAYGDMRNIREAMNNGAFDFATKPIDMDDLDRTIEKAVNQIHFVRESQREHKQLESLMTELTLANEIQQYFLPREFPSFPEDSDKLDLYASMEAAKDVGGDFYDFFRIDDDRIAVVIADVCGKGIPAAMMMGVSRMIIHTKGSQGVSAAECIAASNQMLAAYSVDDMFVTVFYAIYNTKTGLLNYCNAGHLPPHILRANGTIEVLPKRMNLMVGAFDGVEYRENTTQLEQGDTLVMFTDGVTEAMNAAKEEFGNERLDSILVNERGKSCRQIIESVRAGIAGFVEGAEQHDDITILVMRRNE